MARAYRAAAAVALAALAGLLAALWAGGAASEKVIPGISDAGRLVRWGLPLSRTLMDLGAAVTLGCLVMAVLLLPLVKGGLSAASEKYLHAASWAAAVWAAGAAGTLVLTVADILGVPILTVLQGNELSSYVGQLPQGTGLLIVILLVVVVALLSRTITSPASAIGVLVLAFAALLPPALTGHSAASANHNVAVIGLALHLAAVVPWVGGLAVLTWHALTKERLLDTAAERFSRLAVWCFAVTGLSGLANTISRIPDPLQLFDSDYGRLILAKIVAFAVLGWFGWQHRERTIPLIRAKKPLAFTRLAVVEAAIMAATMGVAVALSRTAAPAPSLPESSIKALIGYEMPPPVTALRLVSLWRLDLFFLALVLALGGFYVAGVVRLRRRGDKWPWGRLAAWIAGLLSIVAVTMTGVATYAPLLFSVHMSQHMTLAMMSPIFLVLGAPMTLALRALRPAAVKGDNGPREWLVMALHSRFVKVVSHPLVATALFIGSTYALYFSPAFEWMMRNHLGHIFMLMHFLVTGFLYYWVIIGVDPAPRQLPYVAKLLLLFVTMPFHAFFGIALMNMGEPIAPGWYDAVHPPWAVGQVHDLQTGGAIAWGFGEIPTFVVLLAIVFQWAMADTRRSRREDRKAVLDDDKELAAYNAMLAKLGRKPGEATSAE
ncbi:cytochrome c oxidase assembly protein [Actinocorallia longicatena]|uniref:Cytochrome c oxidase assembly protein n=1 Tax=Actinocorallia longicatena TaxID=111803 RepID=A0ABP6QGE6_9ACTN